MERNFAALTRRVSQDVFVRVGSRGRERRAPRAALAEPLARRAAGDKGRRVLT